MVPLQGEGGPNRSQGGGWNSSVLVTNEYFSATSSWSSDTTYSIPSSNCSSNTLLRAAHFPSLPSSIGLSERQESVVSISELMLDSWQGGESESAFDSFLAGTTKKRERNHACFLAADRK